MATKQVVEGFSCKMCRDDAPSTLPCPVVGCTLQRGGVHRLYGLITHMRSCHAGNIIGVFIRIYSVTFHSSPALTKLSHADALGLDKNIKQLVMEHGRPSNGLPKSSRGSEPVLCIGMYQCRTKVWINICNVPGLVPRTISVKQISRLCLQKY